MANKRKKSVCAGCGGKCCQSIGIPQHVSLTHIHEVGLPVSIYENPLCPDARIWLGYHLGITIEGDVFRVDEDVEVLVVQGPGERRIVAAAPCNQLTVGGWCSIYKDRPVMCRNFMLETAHHYLVPKGCVYDVAGTGVDLTRVFAASKRLRRQRALQEAEPDAED